MDRGYQSVEAGFSWVGPRDEDFGGVIADLCRMIRMAGPGSRTQICAFQPRALQYGVGSTGFGVPPQTHRSLRRTSLRETAAES